MKKYVLALLAVFLGLFSQAYATVPAEITTALTDINDVWDDVKLLILAVGLFLIMWKFFRKGTSKSG